MNKTIQTTLDGKKMASNGNSGNGKEFRLEEVFIACLLLAKTVEGDTYRDILKKVAAYAPMIRWKNEAMIKRVLEKLEYDLGFMHTIGTPLRVIVNGKAPEKETEAGEFFKKVLKFGDLLQYP